MTPGDDDARKRIVAVCMGTVAGGVVGVPLGGVVDGVVEGVVDGVVDGVLVLGDAVAAGSLPPPPPPPPHASVAITQHTDSRFTTSRKDIARGAREPSVVRAAPRVVAVRGDLMRTTSSRFPQSNVTRNTFWRKASSPGPDRSASAQHSVALSGALKKTVATTRVETTMLRARNEVSPITKDDESLRAALKEAHIPSLMLALVHISGDAAWIRGGIRPVSAFFGDAQGGISEAQQAEIRARAFDLLRNYREAGQRLPDPPSAGLVHEMVNFIIGKEVSPDYAAFLEAELAMNDEDPYAAPGLAELAADARGGFRVLIIGAGMSGLLAGIRLKEAGIPFLILERHANVGGTWYQNTYPGCRVDSPNHTYSYSFRPNDWPQYYSQQEVLRRYFDEAATDYGLREQIRFETPVRAARYDEARAIWCVEVERPDGGRETLEANAVISAVGQLDRPKWPDIPGRDRFQGISFHSAEWRHEHDLTGKRILVIGTGASAFQFAPEIAKTAAEVVIFQRTPPWISTTPDYHADVPPGKHWLLNHVPFYAKWYRFSMFWRVAEGILEAVEKDPTWPDPRLSISANNEELRKLFIASLEELCGDDKGLLAKVTPTYPPGGKRILIDNGNWIRALRRPNVRLVTDRIREINTTGVVSESGVQYDADVLIYGTGFQASRFLWPMKITGRRGVDLHQHWGGDPRAYLGITIPGFPNLFCLYGPNTNIVVNGSIVFFSECEVRYILGCVKLLLEGGHAALDCKPEVHDAFNRGIDAGNLRMAWGAADVPTWYKNDKGRVTQNWPFTLVEYWNQTRAPNPADYTFLDRSG